MYSEAKYDGRVSSADRPTVAIVLTRSRIPRMNASS
jgi:hypothetical protein